MPRSPERALNLEHNYNLLTTVPGWLKNEIIDLCEAEGVSVSQWVCLTLLSGVRASQGVPVLSDGRRLPDAAEILSEYFSGVRVVYPCGRTDCTPVIVSVAGVEFCDPCGVRCG